MTDTFLDSTLDVLATLLSGLGAAALTGLGVLAEQAGFHNLAVGQISVGAWETAIGAVVLFAGIYLLGYGQFWRRIRLIVAHA